MSERNDSFNAFDEEMNKTSAPQQDQAVDVEYEPVAENEPAKPETEKTASAGGSAVTATVANKQITALEIKPEAVKPEDVEMLCDLVMTAVNDALRQCEETTNREMQKLTGGMNLGF